MSQFASSRTIVPSLTGRIVFGLCLFVFSQPAYAADVGKVAVEIRGPEKRSVKVELSGAPIETPLEKRTGSKGTVNFTRLSPGTYTVTPRKSGGKFSPDARIITVAAGRTTRIRFGTSSMPKKVGMTYCVGCHSNFTPDIYSAWLKGPHGNFNNMDGTTHTNYDYEAFISGAFSYPGDQTKFIGFPSIEMIGDSKGCNTCHGPLAQDNKKVATFPLVRPNGSVDPVNDTQEQRSVIGCETCHGSGRKHIAAPNRALPFDDPGAAQCGQCHNKDFPTDHLRFHPEGAAGVNNPGIYEAYMQSPHPSSINEHVFANEKQTEVRALCGKCHTDEGGRIYRLIQADGPTLSTVMSGEANLKEFSPVQCRTCHNAHNPLELLNPATAANSTQLARSAEFNTCTNCHQLLNSADDGKITPFHSTHSASITRTHYDDPNTQALEGYNVNRTSDTACSDCHNPHFAGLEVNRQWAESGHGDLEGLAWEEYNWGKVSNRAACRKCHTTTGFASYMSDPANYDPAKLASTFNWLQGLQNETLYCNGCHSDSAFNTRTISTVPVPSGASLSLGDDSNLCMVCHTGRESGVTVENRIKGPAPYTFVNVHYYPASAVLWGAEAKGGFEYPGKHYVGRNSFPGHQGNLDTCVKCHMRTATSDPGDHRFEPQVSDCSGCHTGITSLEDIRPQLTPDYDGDGDTTEGIKFEVSTIRDALLPLITSYAANTLGFPIVYDPAVNSYWFRDTNGNGIHESSEKTGYDKFDAKLLEAAYNYHLSVKEPCGHIHNSQYVIQLLIDSIKDLGGDAGDFIRPF